MYTFLFDVKKKWFQVFLLKFFAKIISTIGYILNSVTHLQEQWYKSQCILCGKRIKYSSFGLCTHVSFFK